MVRNPVVPQMPERIVETVNAIPKDWISERICGHPSCSSRGTDLLQ